jgi:hypothetical protein
VKNGLIKPPTYRIRCTNSEDEEDVYEYNSAKEAAEDFDVSVGAIYAACNGRVKLCRNFKMEYIK